MFPISLEPKIGKRHYFDCYEFAIGGLLNYYLCDTPFLKALYSLFDAISLSTNDKNIVEIFSRSVNVNEIILKNLGFEIVKFDSLNSLLKNKPTPDPFYVDFDEFYFEDYHHYKKTHFKHASIATEIIDFKVIKILDPVLDFTRHTSYDEKLLTLPTKLDDPNAIFYHFIRPYYSQPLINYKLAANQILQFISENNLKIWESSDIVQSDSIAHYFGFKAYKKFFDLLQDLQMSKVAATQFYKWIFPLVWKLEYVKTFTIKVCKAIADLLEQMQHEMELLETILLRLTSSTSPKLHQAAIRRWEKIMSLATQYLTLEKQRIYEIR